MCYCLVTCDMCHDEDNLDVLPQHPTPPGQTLCRNRSQQYHQTKREPFYIVYPHGFHHFLIPLSCDILLPDPPCLRCDPCHRYLKCDAASCLTWPRLDGEFKLCLDCRESVIARNVWITSISAPAWMRIPAAEMFWASVTTDTRRSPPTSPHTRPYQPVPSRSLCTY